MKLHVNRHSSFADPERAEVEARVIERVETDPETLFKLYRKLPESLDGRYINSDLFKEIFPEYSSSPAHRTVFNVPVHNSAAVLANAFFHERVAAKDPQNRQHVLFITGIPGAGKSTAIQQNLLNLSDYKVIYEGQLSKFEQAKEKIDWCLQHGCDVTVYAFHQSPEKALQNTFARFNSLGRGASITAMSNIQGNLGDSIERLDRLYDKQAVFCVVDLREEDITPQCGKKGIQILKSEGDSDAIRKRLEAELEQWRNAGKIFVLSICVRKILHRSAAKKAYKFLKAKEIAMQSESDLKQNLNSGETQEKLANHASESQLAKDHLASQRCKNFMKVVREINAKLRDNPEAQMEHAKTLW